MRYILSIIGLALVVGVGYFTLTQCVNVAHGQSGLTSVDQGVNNPNGAQVLALLNRLKSVSLRADIFSDRNFLTLQDRSVAIDTQMVGRSNPFLPAFGAVRTATSTAKAPILKKK